MSEQDSTPRLANVMQEPDTGDSQSDAQTGSQEASTEQPDESESARVNGLMSTLGRRTNERDAAARERDQALNERDEAQRVLDELLRQHAAQPSQSEVLADDEAERSTLTSQPEPAFDTEGNVLMTQAQWQAEERAGRTFAPTTPSRASQTRRDPHTEDLAALDKAINAHLRGSR